jgi:hypothetical protein
VLKQCGQAVTIFFHAINRSALQYFAGQASKHELVSGTSAVPVQLSSVPRTANFNPILLIIHTQQTIHNPPKIFQIFALVANGHSWNS